MKDIEGIEHAVETLKPHWEEIEAEFERHNRRFLQLINASHNEIGRVLRTHLVIENFMNTFLAAQLSVDDIEDLRLSFIQKAKLLPANGSSAAVVRPGILQLNAVRNKFAHRLQHSVSVGEIGAIYEVLRFARPTTNFTAPLDALEAFAAVACAFLIVSPPKIQKHFAEAFSEIRTHSPENVYGV
ncbi:hypothetical protein IZ6_28460 [Terrihabitans soli]|uniref:Uncharacterized protein n=1 Tax=Terrihabitans soli TaxID=708113 RepID=A0A6S6QYJ9_9HYPH|nr:hypothetical protein [Terrihabitans soli]BCJ92111.1 hypothetical protein IZ6_28460 [Terrihabitans soli]